METVKTIKDVDDQTWSRFKSLAAANNQKAGQMFKIMVDDYEKNAKGWWERILAHKPVFSPKEYADIERKMKAFRKESGWRI